MAQITIRLWGRFEVFLDDQPVTSFESLKVRLLLVYLAAEAGRPQPRGALAGLLWPDWPEAAAHKNLRHSLYSLRKTLGDPACLDSDRQQITLVPDDDCQIDILEFERALANLQGAGSATIQPPEVVLAAYDLQAAVDAAQGPFLDGMLVKDSPEYETWLLARREHLNAQLLQACAFLGGWWENKGDLAQAEVFLHRQIDLEPWHELAHRKLMRLFARQGRGTEALALFADLRRVLQAELNTEPSPETAKLAEQIRNGEIPAQPQTAQEEIKPRSDLPFSAENLRQLSHNLPEAVNRFIGREQDTLTVKDLLDHHRLVCLVGPGGVGKTRLALNAARELLPLYKNGVWLVELAALNEPELVPQVVASTLHLRKNQNQSLLETLVEHLQDRHLLLVLDNCEHLIDASALLAGTLLSQCPRISILVTSRERLAIDGETIFSLQPMQVPSEAGAASLEKLAQCEAVLLFLERGQALRPGFKITAENAASIALVCRRLEGIPLALELAAARLQVLDVDQIAQRLDDRFHLLTGGKRGVLPHHQTLLASIDWSHALLSPGEQRLLRRLAVFAGGWTLEAAEAVGGGDGLERVAVLDHLEQLVSKSLVDAKLDSGQQRFSILETIRQYAQAQLEKAGEHLAVRDRHLDYYLGYGETWGSQLKTWEYPQVIHQLDAEIENIRQAIQWSCDQPEVAIVEKGLRLANALGGYWDLRGLPLEGYRWLMKGIAILSETQPQPVSVLANAYFHVGNLLFYLEGTVILKDGRNMLEKSIAYAEQIQDYELLAMAQSRMADFIMHKFFWPSEKAAQSIEYEEASRLVNRSLVFLEGEDISAAMAYATYMKGSIVHYAGDYPFARKYLEKALRMAREVGDNFTIYASLLNLGAVLLLMGDFAGSTNYYRQGLEWSHSITDNHYSSLLFLSGLLTSSLCEGSYPSLDAWGQEALELSMYFGDTRMEAFVRRMLAIAALRQGRFQQAAAYLQGSIQMARISNDVYGIVIYLAIMAGIAVETNQPALAARWIGAADVGITAHFKPFDQHDQIQIEHFTLRAKAQLGEEAWHSNYLAGRRLSIEAALAEVESMLSQFEW